MTRATVQTPRRFHLAAALGLAICTSWTQQADAVDLCGCWEGTWKSCTDQFKGTVKARITKCDDTHYRAVFTGRAFKIMPYRYVAILTAEHDPETGEMHFRCTQKLPFWGCYWMNGYVTDCCFHAKYRTVDHTGIFTMQRVSCK